MLSKSHQESIRIVWNYYVKYCFVMTKWKIVNDYETSYDSGIKIKPFISLRNLKRKEKLNQNMQEGNYVINKQNPGKSPIEEEKLETIWRNWSMEYEN
jgi:hypothetical protein